MTNKPIPRASHLRFQTHSGRWTGSEKTKKEPAGNKADRLHLTGIQIRLSKALIEQGRQPVGCSLDEPPLVTKHHSVTSFRTDHPVGRQSSLATAGLGSRREPRSLTGTMLK
jgi:hypothetical protein